MANPQDSERTVTVAAVQMVSMATLDENLEAARRLVGEATAAGASVVVLPAFWGMLGCGRQAWPCLCEVLTSCPALAVHPMQHYLSALAKLHAIYLFGGSMLVKPDAADAKPTCTTLVYGPTGDLVARYDKVHLLKCNLGRTEHDEAASTLQGDPKQVPIVDLPWGRVGFGICYDICFPEFFRALAGAPLMTISAAFPKQPGAIQWETLVRARAIENQCYVLAAAQGGKPANGHPVSGRSMLVDPWGTIVAKLDDEEGFVLGAVDLSVVYTVRTMLPALESRCL
ncbi:nitrilase [Achlya hypogyna]|uniref:Nitrilase n=1 Tax=Achlya hypogyna TaxID=1202772 RepID=A0A1V9ZH61_ACHHY|nr:nitrilase [Achlya hypogyna]